MIKDDKRKHAILFFLDIFDTCADTGNDASYDLAKDALQKLR